MRHSTNSPLAKLRRLKDLATSRLNAHRDPLLHTGPRTPPDPHSR
ncbi:hypothetical protein GCM10027271_40820 [Saccharopolyspora gloriosae]|uniref:Uncharacterized protein n=1 Tax=Saccharopolyspora gloriosae TaxID=455344 RepID=A0A840NG27_9PSEU|nr:hypothetical protein [Saccharopolyspora gloriosae]MBB5069035.1 hypothetical protein [Saccharopolyspora gloriosae]